LLGIYSVFQYELVRELKASLDRKIRETSGVKILLFDEDDLPHSVIYQVLLASFVNKSFGVWANVASHFRPPTESKLYEVNLGTYILQFAYSSFILLQ